MPLPPDPFGRVTSALPATFSREGRVMVAAQLAEDLMAGRKPDPVAVAWFFGGFVAWLHSTKRADLVRDYLQLTSAPRSKTTPQLIYRRMCQQKARDHRKADDAPSHSFDIEP